MKMGSHLVPCPACQRHVRATETACPFCAHALPQELRCSAPCALPTTRLSRAALFAFRATLQMIGVVGASGAAASTTVACSRSADVPLYGGSPYLGPPPGSVVGSGGSGGSAGSSGAGGVAGSSVSSTGGTPAYGLAPIPIIGGGGSSTNQTDAGQRDAAQHDAGQVDAGPSDAGQSDASPTDSGRD
jgi:hypothetical protein